MKFSNTIAEEYAVSAILNSPEANISYLKGEQVDSDHFHNHLPKMIWNRCLQLHEQGQTHTIEVLEFSDEIKGLPNGREMSADISRIRCDYAGREFLKQHLLTLKTEYGRRKSYQIASDALEAVSGGESPENISSSLRSGSEAIMSILDSQSAWKTAKQSTKEFHLLMRQIHEEKVAKGTPTGIKEIDDLTGGLSTNEFWVIAAPTSGGKTVLMFQIMANFLKLGKKSVLFSLETEADRVHARLLANMQGIMMSKIMGSAGWKLTQEEKEKTKSYMQDMMTSNSLTICDADSISLESIDSRLAQMIDAGLGVDLIIVDYIQLVGVSNNQGKSREQEVSEVARSLKQLSKKYNCPVLSASQLNDDGKVRESRAISHDCDVLLKIEPEEGVIIVSKNRNGERGGELPLALNGSFQRFESMKRV